jgi:glucose-6-phosphate-specific signal transduction histidine kinase
MHKVEDLVALAGRLSSSGMPVTIETTGEPRDMTAAQQLTVYRLAQESLTNAFKHGDRSQGAHLHLVWGETSLELRVRSSFITSQAVAPDRAPLGRGLAGMRARAAAVGGWVETVRGEETFEVLAFLPVAVPGQHPAVAITKPLRRSLEGAQP